MKVKICGITRLEDALAAVEAGADLLGFNFYPKSPRCVTPAACAEITSRLKPHAKHITLVGVFVNLPPQEVVNIIQCCGLHLAQLSGDEPPADLEILSGQAFKALRPASATELEQALERYPAHEPAPAYLVDAFRPGQYGGTGQTADWRLAAALARQTPILLAGGLTAENAAEAVAQVQPWGVDVASGVESAPGLKDPLKMKAFIRACKK
jgi:phosphoribosylanthranilate isomerase